MEDRADLELHDLEQEALRLARKGVFVRTFSGEDGQKALEHLKEFCYAEETVFCSDAMEMARRAARREVWLAIQDELKPDPEEIKSPPISDHIT